MKIPLRIMILSLTLIAFVPLCWAADKQGSGGQGVGAWLSEPGHAEYAAAKPAGEAAAAEVGKASVPESLLVERMAEGAAKQIDVTVMERALREESARLVQSAAMIDRFFPGLPEGQRTEGIRAGAIALRGGMEQATMDEALGWCVESHIEARRSTAAVAAIASLKRALSLSSEDDLRLIKGLIQSRETPQRFGTFVSLLSGARARGMPAQTLVTVTLSALSRGATFLTIQQDLERRLKE